MSFIGANPVVKLAAILAVVAVLLSSAACQRTGTRHVLATSEAATSLDPVTARTVVAGYDSSVPIVVASICETRIARATISPAATETPLEALVCR